MEIKAGPLLSKIEYPADLKKLGKEQLHQVCTELRQFIIDSVSVNGGHFGASLGVVELSNFPMLVVWSSIFAVLLQVVWLCTRGLCPLPGFSAA